MWLKNLVVLPLRKSFAAKVGAGLTMNGNLIARTAGQLQFASIREKTAGRITTAQRAGADSNLLLSCLALITRIRLAAQRLATGSGRISKASMGATKNGAKTNSAIMQTIHQLSAVCILTFCRIRRSFPW